MEVARLLQALVKEHALAVAVLAVLGVDGMHRDFQESPSRLGRAELAVQRIRMLREDQAVAPLSGRCLSVLVVVVEPLARPGQFLSTPLVACQGFHLVPTLHRSPLSLVVLVTIQITAGCHARGLARRLDAEDRRLAAQRLDFPQSVMVLAVAVLSLVMQPLARLVERVLVEW